MNAAMSLEREPHIGALKLSVPQARVVIHQRASLLYFIVAGEVVT